MNEMKPVIVNGIDITKVEGADLKTKSDEWYHTIELEMIGDNDESTTEDLIDFLKKQKYVLPTLNINQLLKGNHSY